MKSLYRCESFVIFVVAIMCLFSPVAGDDGIPALEPKIDIPRIEGPIDVDGHLSEPAWQSAAIAEGFRESSPGDMTQPEVETIVLVMYDEENLYAAFICYDNPQDIRASLRERDNIFKDDYCGILLDTYGDQNWGYELFVNPLGIQGDLRLQSNGNEDGSFDIIFKSVGQVTDSGFQVEIAIPFASLRFPNKQIQNWRINFWRDRQRESRYRYTWAQISRDNPCFMCQWGEAAGIEGIRPSTNLEILPTAIGFQSGRLANPDNPNSHFDNSNPDGDVSLGIRYGITPNSSAEIAINPDFSQVESDAGEIDVNTTFGLYFPERRPFFQEGSDLFNTPIDVVYTRTINDPDVAGKFTGQFGRYSVALLSAYDKNSPILIPLFERSLNAQAGDAISNIIRAKRVIGNNSYIGLIATDRRLQDYKQGGYDIEGGAGSTYGIDGVLRFLKNWKVMFHAMRSQTREPGEGKPDSLKVITDSSLTFDRGRHTAEFDGESFGGLGMYASLDRNTRHLRTTLSYSEFGPAFRTDNGFTTRNDTRTIEFSTDLEFNPDREWLEGWSADLEIARVWDYDGTIRLDPGNFTDGARDEWIVPSVSFTTKGQTTIGLTYIFSRERFAGEIFPGIRRGSIEISSRFSEYVNFGAELLKGRVIYRDRRNPELGETTDFSLFLSVKPTMRLYCTINYDFARLNHRDTYFEVYPDAPKRIYSGYILRSRTTYQFTREWYLRLIVQYDDFDEQLSIEPLLTYQLNPFTVFYIGMNSGYHYFDTADYDPDEREFDTSEWAQSSRQVFAKVQYLFRM